MKSRSLSLVVCAALVFLGAVVSAAPDVQQERLDAASLLALGRAPSAAERQACGAPASVAELIARQREQLRGDAAAQRAVVVRAWRDAFGREPGQSENAAALGTYAELVQRHLQWLASHPADYRQVVDRAYRLTVGREAFPMEQDYWRDRATLSFAMLVGCVDSWARRNAPGLMATTGTPSVSINCRYLVTLRLSPAVAAETRLATGLAPADAPALALACGRNLIAPGAGAITSIGGIHFVAAGDEGLALAE
jgi:hypothetical protein